MSEGRVALVTGGASGIGRAVCRRFAEGGLRVAVADIAAEASQRLAEEIGGVAVTMDVAVPDPVQRAVETVGARLGAIEICVNCAGWDELKPFVETDEAFQERVLQINLAGAMRVTRAVLPGMIEHGWGRLVHIASDAGRVGSSLEAIYSGAKGGLIAFSKTIAREVARYGITSNAVCPGPTDTPLLARITEDRERGDKIIAAMTKAVPMRRLGQPDEIAAAVEFLASDDAAFITGQTLSVSGGLTMV